MPKPFDAVCIILVLVAPFASGCGGQRHVPAGTASKDSLEKALTAWRDGKPVGTQAATNLTIQAEDGDWRSGKKLTAFEILGEEPAAADAPRRFKVKLTLDGAAPVETVFFVFGNDPIYVYRDRDYEKHFSAM